MNGLVVAREEATALGIELSDDDLGWLMWNETGWPSFFGGDDPETIYRTQIREALARWIGEHDG